MLRRAGHGSHMENKTVIIKLKTIGIPNKIKQLNNINEAIKVN
jgi:hypothetical protein